MSRRVYSPYSESVRTDVIAQRTIANKMIKEAQPEGIIPRSPRSTKTETIDEARAAHIGVIERTLRHQKEQISRQAMAGQLGLRRDIRTSITQRKSPTAYEAARKLTQAEIESILRHVWGE